jgi:hypothetical protein
MKLLTESHPFLEVDLLDFCSIPYITYTLYASFSDRSRVKSLGFQTICKGNNLPPRLDTVGVCGSNPHAPTIFVSFSSRGLTALQSV